MPAQEMLEFVAYAEQLRLRRDCAIAQSRQSLRFSHTVRRVIEKRFRPKLMTLIPLDSCAGLIKKLTLRIFDEYLIVMDWQ